MRLSECFMGQEGRLEMGHGSRWVTQGGGHVSRWATQGGTCVKMGDSRWLIEQLMIVCEI